MIRIVDQKRSDEVKSGGEGPSLSNSFILTSIFITMVQKMTFDMEMKDNWLVAFHKYHTTLFYQSSVEDNILIGSY